MERYWMSMWIKINVLQTIGYESPERVWECKFILSLTLGLDGMDGQRQALSVTTPGTHFTRDPVGSGPNYEGHGIVDMYTE
jgi:hypothetical protein